MTSHKYVKPIAVYPVSAFMSYWALDVSYGIDTKILVQPFDGNGPMTRHPVWLVVKSDDIGREYITRYGIQMFVDEFMRV